ncbi:putative T7SS-secreted protein [Prauserella muralis]|uniref:Putative T7SS secretion signal domain-containing protein n=1 Tax=Prauserella muralis TaxID=588067 RepID=A0A2V4B6V3_9PSEU|nr:hypothetical protein [Prauserella muralis]PXY30947.1 hypothetical protein BAY60_00480 [Prauserella muralis]TWE14798.1 hypothetical protein FHX69_6957 [Prauserella muralis]
MAELGSTKDPKELVPGDPEAVNAAAEELRGKARVMRTVAEDLGNIRIDGWEGPASSAFWDKFSGEKPNWMLGHDAMNSVADTLGSHADTLTWAQGQAAEAMELWERGEAATREARQEHDALVGAGGPPGAGPAGPVPAFEDPGAGLRKQAQDILDRARRQLEQAGTNNGEAIDAQGGKGPDAPSWLSGPAAYVEEEGPLATSASWDLREGEQITEKAQRQQDEGSRFARYHQFGHQFPENQRGGPDVSAKLGSWQGEANLFKADAKGATQLGDITLAGSAEAKVGAEAHASASLGRDGLQAEAGASAGASASVDGSAHYGVAEVGGSGEVFAGAEAEAELSAGPDGLHAGADAFAGAKAEGEVHADVGGLGAGATGEAWAGIGAEANATLGMHDGKFTIGGEAGVALGVGGKLGGEITIDPGKVVDTASDAAGAIGNAASGAVDKAGDIAGTLNPFD